MPVVGFLDKNCYMNLKIVLLYTIVVGFMSACHKNDIPKIDPVASLFAKTTIAAEKEYRNINGISLKLDVYVPSKRLGEPPWVVYTENKKPVMLYFHGGGWRSGEKESRALEILPYVEKGWIVVTANYRLLHQTSLPDIIGDCRTALNWVYKNADKYRMNTNQIFLSGNSAGGHLALMTALVKEDTFYGSEFPLKDNIKIAGIINWYGITDVSLFTEDWKDKNILTKDSIPLNLIYKKTSPINFIDKNTPPIITVHGTIDKIVKFKQAKMLHKKLDSLAIKNKLIAVDNRKHGNFNALEMTRIYKEIWKFLEEIEQKTN
jgi:acetyl esterase/lipase